MKARSWLKYFVYVLLIIGVVWLKGFLDTTVQTDYNATNKMNYWLYYGAILSPILIGLIIGLDAFLNEKAKEGKWKLNLPKLILVTIPSLYASMLYFIVLIQNETVYNIFVTPLIKFFGNNGGAFIVFFQITLGYSLITMLNKNSVNKLVVATENDLIDDVIETQDNENENTILEDTNESAEIVNDEKDDSAQATEDGIIEN